MDLSFFTCISPQFSAVPLRLTLITFTVFLFSYRVSPPMTELRTRESQEIMKAEEQQLAQTIAEHVNILDSGLWLLNETKKKVSRSLFTGLENMSFFKIQLTLS